MDDLDAIVLFSGTWVWAAHLVAALRDFAATGKGIVLWTNPGSQGWRPVGGLVMHGGLKEVGIPHRFVYGSYDDPRTIERIGAYCRAERDGQPAEHEHLGAFGGRGMGQTCGVADPSQWMRIFGVDIDSRDTTLLLETAKAVTPAEVEAARAHIQPFFSVPIPDDAASERSIRLYVALEEARGAGGLGLLHHPVVPRPGRRLQRDLLCAEHDGAGRRPTATLSDFNTTMSVKLLMDLSGERVYYGDLQHIDKATREIKIIGDGACPPGLTGTLEPVTFAEHGIPTEGAAGGLSIQLTCRPGEGVLARLGRNRGEFELVVTRCTVAEPADADELARRKAECGIPFWPHAFVTAECDIDALLEAWNNEYAVLGYGAHLYEDLIAFCELTGIKAIAL